MYARKTPPQLQDALTYIYIIYTHNISVSIYTIYIVHSEHRCSSRCPNLHTYYIYYMNKYIYNIYYIYILQSEHRCSSKLIYILYILYG